MAEEYGEYRALYMHEASGQMGGPNNMNLLIWLQFSCDVRKLANTVDMLNFTFFI